MKKRSKKYIRMKFIRKSFKKAIFKNHPSWKSLGFMETIRQTIVSEIISTPKNDKA